MGIIQLVHGFGEHSRRYLHTIVKFLDAGFIVAADDHVGHGRIAIVNDSWGDWGDRGVHTMMEDERTLTKLAKEKYPGLPYFLFGHSMGSFIARDYITAYGQELTAVTLCGTSGVFPGLEQVMSMLQAAVEAGKGDESDPHAAGALLGWMCERCTEGVKFPSLVSSTCSTWCPFVFYQVLASLGYFFLGIAKAFCNHQHSWWFSFTTNAPGSLRDFPAQCAGNKHELKYRLGIYGSIY